MKQALKPRKGDKAKVTFTGWSMSQLPFRYTERWGKVEKVDSLGQVYLSYPKTVRASQLVALADNLVFMRPNKTPVYFTWYEKGN